MQAFHPLNFIACWFMRSHRLWSIMEFTDGESRPIFNPHRWLRLIQMTRGIIWSTCVGVAKGLRVRRGQRALSRLLDRQEASFSRAHADKKEQHVCGSAADTQVHPVPGESIAESAAHFIERPIENKRTESRWNADKFFSTPETGRTQCRINMWLVREGYVGRLNAYSGFLLHTIGRDIDPGKASRRTRRYVFRRERPRARLASIIPDSSMVAEDDGAEHLPVFSRFVLRRWEKGVCLFRGIIAGRRRRTSQTTTGTGTMGIKSFWE